MQSSFSSQTKVALRHFKREKVTKKIQKMEHFLKLKKKGLGTKLLILKSTIAFPYLMTSLGVFVMHIVMCLLAVNNWHLEYY